MSLTSYRAAPPRVIRANPKDLSRPAFCVSKIASVYLCHFALAKWRAFGSAECWFYQRKFVRTCRFFSANPKDLSPCSSLPVLEGFASAVRRRLLHQRDTAAFCVFSGLFYRSKKAA
jgi:hypothetical protein